MEEGTSKKYSVVDQLNKTPAQISILILLQASKNHKRTLMRILSEAYMSATIIGGEMAHMVRQVFEAYKISFHEDEIPLEGRLNN